MSYSIGVLGDQSFIFMCAASPTTTILTTSALEPLEATNHHGRHTTIDGSHTGHEKPESKCHGKLVPESCEEHLSFFKSL